VFRNEPKSRLHLQEFTLLEWYRVGGSLQNLIHDCEELWAQISSLRGGEADAAVHAGLLRSARNDESFEIRTLQDLWLEYAKIDLRAALIADDLVDQVQSAGFVLRPGADFFDAFHHVMLTAIEPKIGQQAPCVVTKWPREMAALARICEDDVYFAERFEIYYQGIELGNAFLELTDPVEQRGRFLEEQEQRRKLGKTGGKVDEDFLTDLALMPAAAGIAVGFDRLLMCAAKARQIDELDFFSQKMLNG
jgi:lysyl-tRNA synthetase class 2